MAKCEIHDEFEKRMAQEHERMNHRLKNLESCMDRIESLTVSIEKMTITMQNMVEEQTKIKESVTTLENRDGDKWRSFVWQAFILVIGGVVGYFLKRAGL